MNNKTILLLALLLIPLTTALDINLTTNPEGNISTTTTLNCIITGTGTGTLTANITWYKNGAPHTTDNQTISLTSGIPQSTSGIGAIETSDTTKNDIWTCQGTLGNTTHTNTTNTTTVTIINSAPVITSPITTQNSYEDSTYGPIQAQATDPDGDNITTWISSDLNQSQYGGELFTITTGGIITFTPTQTEAGLHTIALLASDGELLGGRNVNFQVNAVNDKPIMEPLADKNATEGTSFDYLISGTDEEDDPFNWSIETNLTALIINQNNATHATITFSTGTPLYQHRGSHEVNVTIYETGNTSHNTTNNFTLTVFTINRAPVLDAIPNPASTQGNLYNTTITANDEDTTDTLNFTITSHCGTTNPWTINNINNSNNATINLVATNLTNNHVICRNITVTVRDYELGFAKESDEENIILNIINTNDAPTIYENSSNAENTNSQRDITNLTTAEDLLFTYWVNASDPDTLTYEGESINYTDNTTLFNISPTTGVINFTPGTGGINELILITVTDDEGLSDNIIMNLTVAANTFPTLTPENNLLCQEDSNCTATLEANDPDVGETLTYTITITNYSINTNATINTTWTTNNITSNTTTIWKNFTNNMVGNYTYNITVTDQYGATDSQLWNVTINNTNDNPFYDQNMDGTRDNITIGSTVVETYETLFYIYVQDDDFININETLTLNTTITGTNTSLFTPSKTAESLWEVRFTPNTDSQGSYTANFTVTDSLGGSDTQILSFEVYNRSIPPNITEVQPFYNVSLGGTLLTKGPTTNMGGSTRINLSEGGTYTFNITFTDPDSSGNNITIQYWNNTELLLNETQNGDYALTVSYDYFSARDYVYIVNVTDERYETSTFQWNITVDNVNRPPTRIANLTDREINQTTTISNYMSLFYDPDDDTNSNGEIDGTETNTLTFTNTQPDYLQITYSGTDTTLEPTGTGTDTITYTASDGLASVQSNIVTYNVTLPPEETTTSSSGGGGGSSSVPYPIPIKDDPEPFTIDLLSPQPIVIYYNDTIAAPIRIHNPSDITIRDITLRAEAPEANATFVWSKSAIDILEPNEEENVTLYITNYRSAGTYEIKIIGEATEPEVNDSAVIFINSLEAGSNGEAVRTKVTFARDLLETNPECLELNELLNQANRAITTNQLSEAENLITSVIEGCRYLVQQSTLEEQEPGGIDVSFFTKYRYANIVLAGLLIVLAGIATLLILHYYSSNKHDEE